MTWASERTGPRIVTKFSGFCWDGWPQIMTFLVACTGSFWGGVFKGRGNKKIWPPYLHLRGWGT